MGINSINVQYTDNSETKIKQVSFDGNYGFNINGEKYTVKDGKVLNSKGEEVNIITLSKAEAYQFIGMSNMNSAEGEEKKDYTYTAKDFSVMEGLVHQVGQSSAYLGTEEGCQAKNQISLTLGTGAGQYISGSVEDGIFSTKCQERGKYEGSINHISIWMLK